MILTGIRARMLAAALVPVFLVVIIIVGTFLVGRVADLDASHVQRTGLLVRQVAMASEYGLFSGNTASVQSAVNVVKREPDVRFVAVFDASGVLLAKAGVTIDASIARFSSPGYVARQYASGVDVLVEEITTGNVQIDDLFTEQTQAQSVRPLVLGYAVVELSRDRLKKRERDLLLVAVAVGLAGLLLGGILAVRMGELVVRPILRVSHRIGRIGQGDFSIEKQLNTRDPLHELQEGLNQMAIRLAWGRDEMEQRVNAVTQELRLKKDEAERATLAKSRFLAAASHDLRQPTHALGMFVARLRQLPMDEPTHQLVGSLDASVQAMQDLLDGLLDISRLDAGAVPVHVRPVNLGDMLNSLRVALVSVAVEKGLRLRVRPTRLWAMSDPVLLQRILMNLASNALRYTERGTVLVCCRAVDGGLGVRVDVLDSGIGISAEHQSDIFKEFYQVGNAARDRVRGLGLGLNIVERSAQLLGHPLGLRSSPGCGTRFSITVPAAPVSEPEPTVVLADTSPIAALEGVQILVIEDDDFSLEALCDLLESWGCRVSAAASQDQARGLLLNGYVPDAIVSDYRLGAQGNGLRLIADLRALAGRDIPACLMSGDTDAGLMQAAKEADLTLLHKPVRPAKLRNLLRHLVVAPHHSGEGFPASGLG